MSGGAAFRGQPLLLLGGLLGGWIALRAVFWQPVLGFPAAQALVPSLVTATAPAPLVSAGPADDDANGLRYDVPNLEPAVPTFTREPLAPMWRTATVPLFRPDSSATAPPMSQAPSATIGAAVAHNVMLLAGLSGILPPPEVAAYLQKAPAPVPQLIAAAPAVPPTNSEPRSARWSADAWLFLRRDSGGPLAAAQPSYGRSQAGSVLRYRLAPQSGHRAEAYVRGVTAVSGPREREAALGLSARPFAGVPLRVAAEVRGSDRIGGSEVRPAAFAVTELPPVALPLGARAEVYVQAGYVGGRFATAFVDGQGRITRALTQGDSPSLSVGGGAWGGAQKGAARLDVGPTADVSFRLGDARARVAADYRFRVAGDAAPASGPALTVSAGF